MSWSDTARSLFSGGSSPLWQQAKTYAPSLAQIEPYWPQDLEKNLLPAASALLAVDQVKKMHIYYANGKTWEALKSIGSAIALGAYSYWARPGQEVTLVAFGIYAALKISTKIYNTAELCCKRTFERKFHFKCFECFQPTNDTPRQRLITCATCNYSNHVSPDNHGFYTLRKPLL